MPDCVNLEQYEALFEANHRTSGSGPDAVQHFPCPFCAAADWYEVPARAFGETTSAIYCDSCNRSARFVSSTVTGARAVELVQVFGPDAPAWMDPAPRREDIEPQAPSQGHLEATSHRPSRLR